MHGFLKKSNAFPYRPHCSWKSSCKPSKVSLSNWTLWFFYMVVLMFIMRAKGLTDLDANYADYTYTVHSAS